MHIRLPYCVENERLSKHFIQKLKKFTGDGISFNIIWQSKKIKTFFQLKDKVLHKANIIYRGTSINNPDVTYIGESKLNAELRWKQHETPSHDSAPSNYLMMNIEDSFHWETLVTSVVCTNKRKILEALYIRKYNPILNRQIEHRSLILFRSGVT